MTLLEIRNQIVNVLLKNDLFSLKNDNSKIKIDKCQLNIKDDLIRLAFKDLEKAEIVMYAKTGDDEIWAVEFPFASQGQDVSISHVTAEALADLINNFKEVIGNGKNNQPTDKLAITEQDIQQLIIMSRTILEKEDSK